jgi:hypothetical protein
VLRYLEGYLVEQSVEVLRFKFTGLITDVVIFTDIILPAELWSWVLLIL